MLSFNINNSFYKSENILYNLKNYMIHEVTADAIELIYKNHNKSKSLEKNNKHDLNIENNIKKSHNLDKKPNIYVNYNKFNSKYNEKLQKFNLNKFSDTLFWTAYLFINKLEFEDLNNINPFKVEKTNKINLLEQFKLKKDILKQHKIKLSLIEDNLLNKDKIDFTTFIALIYLYDLKLFIFKDNNTYSIINDKNMKDCANINKEDDLLNKDYFFIKLETKNGSNYEVTIYNYNNDENKLNNENINNIINNYYYLENINKPLKCISNYKANDLYIICNKLNINIYINANKKKTKQTLYDAIYNKLL